MASYLVLIPPGGTAAEREKSRFLRDGYSAVAFLFPAIWLFVHRLWLAGLTAAFLQGIGFAMMRDGGLALFGAALLFATSLLTALEGVHLLSATLIRKDWTLNSVITAETLDAAEEMYFAAAAAPAPASRAATDWNALAIRPGVGRAGSGPALGLLELDGGR